MLNLDKEQATEMTVMPGHASQFLGSVGSTPYPYCLGETWDLQLAEKWTTCVPPVNRQRSSSDTQSLFCL